MLPYSPQDQPLRNRHGAARSLLRQIYGPYSDHAVITSSVSSNIRPWRWWKGASGDVMSLSWSPDGTKFAAGAVTNGQGYDRETNLVVGDLTRNSLTEVTGHYVQSILDDFEFEPCFKTITASKWIGERLFTGSYDRTVKIWDIQEEGGAVCAETLPHDSELVAIAQSSHHEDMIATASEQEFYLWDLRVDTRWFDLPIRRSTRPHSLEFEPTALAWGQTAHTSHVLVGGMAGSYCLRSLETNPFGHLQMWTIAESIIIPRKVTPDSQHIFAVKWHPTAAQLATASTSKGLCLPRNTRSAVQIYDLLKDKLVATNLFACPANDINEVTFCPRGSYITASCTNGVTYVWDERNPDKLLHELSHDPSLYPTSEENPLGSNEFGVGAALWGSTIDQFYTGSSDGVLNQWDIRRSPSDVLVAKTAALSDGITSGVFSEDKSHLLLGDSGGGIHVLSSGPCSDPEPGEMEFFRDPISNGQDAHRASSIANDFILSEQLSMHPVYGPVQGRHYSGPFARWARGEIKENDVNIRDIPLLKKYQLRQFDGPPVEDRHELSNEEKNELERHIHIAEARVSYMTQMQSVRNRLRKRTNEVNKSRSDSPSDASLRKPLKRSNNVQKELDRKSKKPRSSVGGNRESIDPTAVACCIEVIDLTGDSDAPEIIDLTCEPEDNSSFKSSDNISPMRKVRRKGEDLEDDYWWPDNSQVNANIPAW